MSIRPMTVCINKCDGCESIIREKTTEGLTEAGWQFIHNSTRSGFQCPKCVEAHPPLTSAPLLTEARKGEIALKLIKYKYRQEGMRIGPHTRREIGSIAKEIGISPEEAMAFVETMVRELVNETFPKRTS
ncbi:MAG: hypothetical protein A3A33_05050 [Candidatus Yanofskybacteria bacterium RIFCSPLOWO2_01_FULL_49_25]|uniref:Uncharacterized protein n=1 Tax=Candidatus Yanofskybacteria bacterium RIFCSPLOWO2_01_FULL_49_25 TaxID=1802701 RepID=A0A1F8GSC7_9BACT|nr:MAG: hypothetical protein A3A33_05050 [Candidatus Yanofskybacteria bacterium RIFCSPLOWO2_01_FULL_49_25]